MLVVSETLRLWSVVGVVVVVVVVVLVVVESLGDILTSGVIESGVGRVDTEARDDVVDDGVVISFADERVGVYVANDDEPLVMVLGDSSGRAADVGVVVLLLLLLPERRRLKESCLFNGARADICVGIVRGGRSLGDGGGRPRALLLSDPPA